MNVFEFSKSVDRMVNQIQNLGSTQRDKFQVDFQSPNHLKIFKREPLQNLCINRVSIHPFPIPTPDKDVPNSLNFRHL